MLKEVADSLQYLDIGKCESISDVSPVQNLRYHAFIYLDHWFYSKIMYFLTPPLIRLDIMSS